MQLMDLKDVIINCISSRDSSAVSPRVAGCNQQGDKLQVGKLCAQF